MSLFHQNCQWGQYYGHYDQGKNKFQVLAHTALGQQDFNEGHRHDNDEDIFDPFSRDFHNHPPFPLTKQASPSDPDDDRQEYDKHHSDKK